MDHREIRDLIPLLAIGRLEGKEKQEVIRHLQRCAECRRIYESERNLLTLMEGTASEVIPPPIPTVSRRGFGGRTVALALSGIAAAIFLTVVLLIERPFGKEESDVRTPVPVEITGLEDLWGGYVLVQGEGEISVSVAVDGKVVATGDTLEIDRVVLYDPETYAMATGGE